MATLPPTRLLSGMGPQAGACPCPELVKVSQNSAPTQDHWEVLLPFISLMPGGLQHWRV